MTIRVDRPLFVELDEFGKRYVVRDEKGNVVYLTDFITNDKEAFQTATLAAMRLGGWLKGAVQGGLVSIDSQQLGKDQDKTE